MKKILNALLIVTSVIAYLEWGGSNNIFLLFAEADIVMKLFTNPTSAVHPFTVVPLLGQILLLATLFQKQPGKWLTFIGMACIGVLLYFIFIIGLLGLNYKIIICSLPFVVTSILTIISYKRPKKNHDAAYHLSKTERIDGY